MRPSTTLMIIGMGIFALYLLYAAPYVSADMDGALGIGRFHDGSFAILNTWFLTGHQFDVYRSIMFAGIVALPLGIALTILGLIKRPKEVTLKLKEMKF